MAISGTTILPLAGLAEVQSLNGLTGNITLVAGSGISITPAGQNITIAATGGSSANTALSNLASTAVNADIIPGLDGDVDLGSPTIGWRTVYSPLFIDPATTITLDLGVGELRDENGDVAIDWKASGSSPRTLFDISGTESITWSTRRLYDSSDVISIAWDNRDLVGSDASLMLRWNTPGVLNAVNNLISNVLDPVSAQDAATKNYVDMNAVFDPASTAFVYDEFDGASASETTGWGNATSGGSATPGPAINAGNPGVLRESVSSSGNVALVYRDQNYILGGGQIDVEVLHRFQALSATEAYITRIGFTDAFNGTAPNNGVWFEYTDTVNSGQWQVLSANGGSTTTVNTTAAVAAGVWSKLHITVDAAATLITFLVDGVSVGTISTDIPTGAIGFMISMKKTNGNSTLSQYTDYWYFKQVFTTPR